MYKEEDERVNYGGNAPSKYKCIQTEARTNLLFTDYRAGLFTEKQTLLLAIIGITSPIHSREPSALITRIRGDSSRARAR